MMNKGLAKHVQILLEHSKHSKFYKNDYRTWILKDVLMLFTAEPYIRSTFNFLDWFNQLIGEEIIM